MAKETTTKNSVTNELCTAEIVFHISSHIQGHFRKIWAKSKRGLELHTLLK
jgi:hypothetical protein